jgi:hypothetical protein
MTSDLLTNPRYWRDRAEEIRSLAEGSIHAETKRMLEAIVVDYELLARRAEERLGGRRTGRLRLVRVHHRAAGGWRHRAG